MHRYTYLNVNYHKMYLDNETLTQKISWVILHAAKLKNSINWFEMYLQCCQTEKKKFCDFVMSQN